MIDAEEIIRHLKDRVESLEAENASLRRELEYVTTHAAIAAGMVGESLIIKMVGGTATKYADSYDVDLKNVNKCTRYK